MCRWWRTEQEPSWGFHLCLSMTDLLHREGKVKAQSSLYLHVNLGGKVALWISDGVVLTVALFSNCLYGSL